MNRFAIRVTVHTLGGVDLGDLVEIEVQGDMSDMELDQQASLYVSQACNELLILIQGETGVDLGQLGVAWQLGFSMGMVSPLVLSPQCRWLWVKCDNCQLIASTTLMTMVSQFL